MLTKFKYINTHYKINAEAKQVVRWPDATRKATLLTNSIFKLEEQNDLLTGTAVYFIAEQMDDFCRVLI